MLSIYTIIRYYCLVTGKQKHATKLAYRSVQIAYDQSSEKAQLFTFGFSNKLRKLNLKTQI